MEILQQPAQTQTRTLAACLVQMAVTAEPLPIFIQQLISMPVTQIIIMSGV